MPPRRCGKPFSSGLKRCRRCAVSELRPSFPAAAGSGVGESAALVPFEKPFRKIVGELSAGEFNADERVDPADSVERG